jgi:hypothetical protein
MPASVSRERAARSANEIRWIYSTGAGAEWSSASPPGQRVSASVPAQSAPRQATGTVTRTRTAVAGRRTAGPAAGEVGDVQTGTSASGSRTSSASASIARIVVTSPGTGGVAALNRGGGGGDRHRGHPVRPPAGTADR